MTHSDEPRRPTSRTWLLVLGLTLLVVSLAGLGYAFYRPLVDRAATTGPRYQQQGTFDYRVHLRPNALSDTTDLGPGGTYFARLVNDVRVTFAYHFSSDVPIQAQQLTYQAGALWGAPGSWEKSFPLVPPTTAQGEFTASFTLPLAQYLDLMDTLRNETQADLSSPQLAVKVRVEPQVRTALGTVLEPFEQTLTFTIDHETMRVSGAWTATQAGTWTPLPPQPAATPLRLTCLAGVLLAIGLLAYRMVRPGRASLAVDAELAELQAARARLKRLLVTADDLPPLRDGEIVVQLNSLSALLDMAQETIRPVVYCRNGRGPVYTIIEGLSSVRYEYAGEARSPGQEGQEGRGHAT